ncbi:MAG TPA: hypothetical protein PLD32_13240 [Saprospiraceae bacterium]|nr:hypothetical protein [Saprospiraceae bacterium]HNC37525.1 hypothetical protein [Saprospiraceae bacterium]HNG70271.1 hypothetical protein [Saprospiraceae bacterium]
MIQLANQPKLRKELSDFETDIDQFAYSVRYRMVQGAVQISTVQRLHIATESEYGRKLEEIHPEIWATLISRIEDFEKIN